MTKKDIEEVKEKKDPTFKTTISTEKIVAKKQTFTFTTRFSAKTLEDAFKVAQDKALKMKEEDPEHNEYVVTYINID